MSKTTTASTTPARTADDELKGPSAEPTVKSGGSSSAIFIVSQVLTAVMFFLVVRASQQFHDIQDALAFYGIFHADKFNQLIHFFGVPGIIWSALMFAAHLPLPFMSTQSVWTWNLAFIAFYFVYYLSVDTFGGIMYTPVLAAMYTSCKYFHDQDQKSMKERLVEENRKKTDGSSSSSVTVPWYGSGKVLRYAMLVHFLSWYVQLHIGHHIFEGAKPALTQSLGGAVTVAPLFAYYEGLWFLGINTELQNQTVTLVEEYTKEWCASGRISIRACEKYADLN
mmetsp:Transcript_20157/g.57197  ORF Transcript_20157/g.57197 Transcript_20157/m.57197 type:complete len:281 (-) Transcript_20157:274-1116(-)|eukprot:CAMPEP_0119553972 /NCGR_PEP_ID=MMETSP1352-20130426/6570_1 /TAXON_ID=265584 /ORGANISM="Stauroneis constricta, Strain CCMP1120" /LENGTH=280 /DNA_ID=CAMNT_0007600467 /DNA_START=170 /DNA_END=1012 /DNA_ORIENTATION=-